MIKVDDFGGFGDYFNFPDVPAFDTDFPSPYFISGNIGYDQNGNFQVRLKH